MARFHILSSVTIHGHSSSATMRTSIPAFQKQSERKELPLESVQPSAAVASPSSIRHRNAWRHDTFPKQGYIRYIIKLSGCLNAVDSAVDRGLPRQKRRLRSACAASNTAFFKMIDSSRLGWQRTFFSISNQLESASSGNLARTGSSFQRPRIANGPLFRVLPVWRSSEPRLLASHPLCPNSFLGFLCLQVYQLQCTAKCED